MTDHLKGHSSLADMIYNHIAEWRDALKAQREIISDNGGSDNIINGITHELSVLDDIEAACVIERKKVL